MEFEEIKNRAKNGDVAAQIEVAHAYLTGNGVRKNAAYYLNYLTKAAEQDSPEALKELIIYHSNPCNARAVWSEGHRWKERAKAKGVVFSDEELLEIKDADLCKEKAETYLFGDDIRFPEAKALIQCCRIPKDILQGWAERYHNIHKNDKKRVWEIADLFRLTCYGDADDIYELALSLKKTWGNKDAKIVAALFKEGCRLGNKNAAASYIYCLIYGKGTRKDVKAAVDAYFSFNDRKGIPRQAFTSQKDNSQAVRLPKSIRWHVLCFKKCLGMFFSNPWHYIRLLFDIRSIFLSAAILGAVVFVLVKRNAIPNLSWMTCLLAYLVLTAVLSLVFRLIDKDKNQKQSSELRDIYKQNGWNLPEFEIVSKSDWVISDGFPFGDSVTGTMYILHFKDGKTTYPRNEITYGGMSPKVTATMEMIDDNTVKIIERKTWYV